MDAKLETGTVERQDGERDWPAVALTVAGSDSGGGAGLQADLRTFAAHGVAGACAVTAVTAQDTRRVHGVLPVPAEFVALQARTVLEDLDVDAAKTGMLADAAIVSAVAVVLREWRGRRSDAGGAAWVVVDPVLAAHGGGEPLLARDAIDVLRRELLPACDLLTPNLREAALLLDDDPDEAPSWNRCRREEAARELVSRGAGAVLVKGGHSSLDSGRVAADVLAIGSEVRWLEAPWVSTPHVHGTGCTLSAAVTARLALRADLPAAVMGAKDFLTEALRAARPLGHGRGSPHQLHRLS
jgi:hydroxymethylpyrimidine/phosphomethylpyrimidine kinase